MIARTGWQSSQRFALILLGALAAVVAAAFLIWGDQRDSAKAPLFQPSAEFAAGIARMELSAARAEVRIAAGMLERYRNEHRSRYTGATMAALQRLADQDGFHQALRADIVSVTMTSYCVEARVNEVVASKSGPSADVVDLPCPG